MLPETVISLSGVGKEFYKQEQRTFKELLPALFTGKKTSEWFFAVRNINLRVARGEALGITGSNGSGKSTLLKLIAGVTSPTEGSIKVQGRVAPLIELGAGFHPELTGRENVILNGVILGMSRLEVQSKLGEIIAFAGIQDFIDTPVKHYSSGMYLRLAFSVAIHTNPDILLVDEILAVGDAKFQKKCIARVHTFVKKGGTLILVSHSPELIKATCQKVVKLEQGQLV